MNIMTLLPFIVLIGAMFLMTRSAKNKQRQAAQMRDQMQPGTGVRTIGGMYATVKEVNDDSVLLEIAPGVHAIFAKNSIGAVLQDDEYNRIVHGIEPDESETPVVPDDASSLTETDTPADTKIDLGKGTPAEGEAGKGEKADEAGADEAKDAKRDGKPGDTDAK